jgi:type II secretory pathway component GspD/PulD (secretin)
MFGGGEKLTDTLLSKYALVAMDTDNNIATTAYTDAQTVRASGQPFMNISAPGNIDLGRMSFLNTQLVLEMIRQKTSGSIIQTPDIITIDNEGAYLHIGNTLRFAEQTTITTEGGGSASGFQEASGSPVKTGVTLTILPHVTGPDRNILMSILPEINELVQMRTFTGPDGTQLSLPETSDTTMTTTMLTRNKETVVIGGLKTERKTETNYIVPFLGDLPVIGWLFRSNVSNTNVSKVYIFVTPTIIDFNDRNRFERELSRIREEFSRPFVTQSGGEMPY